MLRSFAEVHIQLSLRVLPGISKAGLRYEVDINRVCHPHNSSRVHRPRKPTDTHTQTDTRTTMETAIKPFCKSASHELS